MRNVPSDTSLIGYYAERANEYERVYDKPERQADLAFLKRISADSLAGQNVLEIACGTGYWTQPISETAKSIVATDINSETLNIARGKQYRCETHFQQADAFDLGPQIGRDFTAGLAMHWWSHVRRSEIRRFLDGYHRRFRPGALLVFMDNRFVAGSNTPIWRTDDEGNTYQRRQLANGKEHEVLKNFPSENDIRHALAGMASEICWTELTYYWFLTYRVAEMSHHNCLSAACRAACERLGVNPTKHLLAVNVAAQTASLFTDGQCVREMRASTSRFGIGQTEGSNCTPLGLHRIAEKIGGGERAGTVFKSRRVVGHTSQPEFADAKITTRILWLEGLEPGFNQGGEVDTHARYIYIHGTADQASIGKPASHGCIHLADEDLISIFELLPSGTLVWIEER